jgi:hypothetical protein
MHGRLRFLVMSSALLAAGCAPAVDLKQAIQVTDVSSGWFDAGIVGGKNKLVPSVTFRLKKSADTSVPALSLNVVFKAEGDTEDWDDFFVQRVDFIDGVQTAPITVRPEKGYTGDPPQSRLDMLKNSLFRDLNAQIFAKQSSSQWTELHRTKIARQLLTQ